MCPQASIGAELRTCQIRTTNCPSPSTEADIPSIMNYSWNYYGNGALINLKLAQIVRPSEALVILDGTNYISNRWRMTEDSHKNIGVPRHNEGAKIGSADGHARWEMPSNYLQVRVWGWRLPKSASPLRLVLQIMESSIAVIVLPLHGSAAGGGKRRRARSQDQARPFRRNDEHVFSGTASFRPVVPASGMYGPERTLDLRGHARLRDMRQAGFIGPHSPLCDSMEKEVVR